MRLVMKDGWFGVSTDAQSQVLLPEAGAYRSTCHYYISTVYKPARTEDVSRLLLRPRT